MRSKFGYYRPESLEEALRLLEEGRGYTSVVAGGTDFSIAVRAGEVSSSRALDISRLAEMRGVRFDDGALRIGAATTFTEIVRSDAVRRYCPVLASACECVGSVQIRNVGTIGGNVANASPAADGVPPLIVHQAKAVVRSTGGERILPVEKLIVAPYATVLEDHELIVEFILDPMDEDSVWTCRRVARRRALAIARMNLAAIAIIDGDRVITEMRLSVGSVTPAPCRMKAAENICVGKPPSLSLAREAAEAVSAEMIRQSGVRASTEYKKPAVEGLVIKGLADLFGFDVS